MVSSEFQEEYIALQKNFQFPTFTKSPIKEKEKVILTYPPVTIEHPVGEFLKLDSRTSKSLLTFFFFFLAFVEISFKYRSRQNGRWNVKLVFFDNENPDGIGEPLQILTDFGNQEKFVLGVKSQSCYFSFC